MNNRKTFLAVLFLVVLMLLVSATTSLVPSKNQASADTVGNGALEGWAWSSNIGWVSFSGSNYGVIRNTDNTLTGYAWANPRDTVGGTNNIGWLNFNPPPPYPDSPTHGVKVEGDKLTGWARFCAGAANPVSCSGGTNSESGGWDGWVKMSGSNYGIKVMNTPPTPSDIAQSFAWGGDVVGWLNFIIDANPDDGPCIPSDTVVCDGGGNSLSVTCHGSPSTIPPNVDTEVTWTAYPTGGVSPLTYNWTDNDGLEGSTQLPQIKKFYTGTIGTNYSATVQATDSTIPTHLSSVQTTCSNSVSVSSSCRDGLYGIPPICLCSDGSTPNPDCANGGDGGTLTVTEGDEVVYIGEQASGQPAASIVKVSQPTARITASGGTVNNVQIKSITSQSGQSLSSIIDPAILLCSLTTGTNDNFVPCTSANIPELTVGGTTGTAYFRIQIPDYLKAIADDSPYEVLIEGDPIDNPEGGSVTPKATLIFQYRVGTYVPQ